MILTSVQMWIINRNPFCIRAEHLLHEMWGIFLPGCMWSLWAPAYVSWSAIYPSTPWRFVNFNFTNMCRKNLVVAKLLLYLHLSLSLSGITVGASGCVCVFKVSRSKSTSTYRTSAALWWALNINGYIKFLTIEHLILNPRNFFKKPCGSICTSEIFVLLNLDQR